MKKKKKSVCLQAADDTAPDVRPPARVPLQQQQQQTQTPYNLLVPYPFPSLAASTSEAKQSTVSKRLRLPFNSDASTHQTTTTIPAFK